MDEYVKQLTLKIATEFERSKLATVKREFKDLTSVKLGLLDDKEIEKTRKAFDEYKKKMYEIETLKQAIAEIEMFDKDSKALDEMRKRLSELEGPSEIGEGEQEDESFIGGFKEAKDEWIKDMTDMKQAGKNAFNAMKNKISKFARDGLKAIKDFVSDAIKELKEMAKWSPNSNVYNSERVSLQLQTGLQGNELYGLSKALETQGFNSMDDFYEAMPYMTKQQLDYMKEIMDIESKNYTNGVETAEKIQNFQKEYAEFKKEMQSELISFFMGNKDTIKTFLDIGIKAMEIIVKALGWMLKRFSSGNERSDSERKQAVADILGVSSTAITNNTNNSRTVSVNNTYNGVGKTDQTWLANTGQMTYRQVIEALG